jgi:aspartyl-tRNA(Asn)/glutamyl-tRNA(Gln) amidotransferase subunit B
MKSEYFPTIGLEIHVELKTNSKMFCSCSNPSETAEPNSLVCPICLGHPGTLPVINKRAMEMVIMVGLALNCEINEQTFFDRKNYFYPDLPKGYQISQHFTPICTNGYLEVEGKKIRIREVHLEEDTCKLIHSKKDNSSLIDCNRSGVPLMELVTEPDIESAEQTAKFGQELHLLFRYLGVSEADMEKGEMRIEANVSLSSQKGKLGTKVELKNINSFKAVKKALSYEIERQAKKLAAGQSIVQQTRGWDDEKGITVVQRTKETAEDYRYFPEPDLPLLNIKKEYIEELRKKLPELPWQRRQRLSEQYQFLDNIEVLVQNKELGDYFEKTISHFSSDLHCRDLKKLIKLSFNYLTSDLKGLLLEKKEISIEPKEFAQLMTMVYESKISSRVAKDVLKEMFETNRGAMEIIEQKDLAQTSDEAEIEKIVGLVIKQNPQPVSDYQQGKETALQFLIGQVMRKSRGKTDPKIVEKLLKQVLSK